jgi:hypothetical protein
MTNAVEETMILGFALREIRARREFDLGQTPFI